MAKEKEVARPTRESLALVGKKIEDINQRHEQAYARATSNFERAFVLSCSMIDLRQAVREYLPVLRELQGSRLGFLTDRDPGKSDKGPYADQVVVDCAVEAIVRGANWVGNEFNIISGGCYLTKEFWARRVRQVEGLTDLELTPGVPELTAAGKCTVAFDATWRLGGRTYTLSRRIPIIVRNYQTDDATLGKAEGKMLRAIYKRVTGAEISDVGDDEPAEVEAIEPAPPAALDAGPAPAAEDRSPAAADPGNPPTAEQMAEWERQEERDRAAAGRPPY